MGASMWRVTVARVGAVRVGWAVVSIGTSGGGERVAGRWERVTLGRGVRTALVSLGTGRS